jgi:hypothetical protein
MELPLIILAKPTISKTQRRNRKSFVSEIIPLIPDKEAEDFSRLFCGNKMSKRSLKNYYKMKTRDKILVFLLSLIPGYIFWLFVKRKDWEDWYL